MISFPNCKINLGLNITGKRGDGYHNLETVFIPVSLTDIIEVIQADVADKPIHYSSGGIPVDTDPSQNLCVKAYSILKNDFPQLPSVRLHLHKLIPTGAGLGGGSADAAFTLTLLNQKFNLDISNDQLMKYALQLGSDVPFFIYNKPCFAGGRGEILEPVEIDVSSYRILLVNPGIQISTAQAFSQVTPAVPAISIKEAIRQPVQEWKELIKNDFEESVFNNFPEIRAIKDELYRSGAAYASMTGSGSTVYGIFEKSAKISHSLPPHYFVETVMPI